MTCEIVCEREVEAELVEENYQTAEKEEKEEEAEMEKSQAEKEAE